MNQSRLFFYGTLREGMYNHYRFFANGGAVKVGNATLADHSLVVAYTLPFLLKESGKSVVGEVWDITDNEKLLALHEMELGAGYTFVECDVTLNISQLVVKAGVYMGNSMPHSSEPIENGDYVEWVRRRAETYRGYAKRVHQRAEMSRQVKGQRF